MTNGRARLRDRPRLVLLVSSFSVVEATLLWVLGPTSALGIAPQVTAPEPFGVFHDLRWLLVYHANWAGFAFEALAFLLFRTAVTTAVVRLAWPDGLARPPLRTALARSAVFTLVAAILLLPWAGLLFGLAIVSVSWLFFAAVPAALLVALLVHQGPVVSGWWRLPPLRTVGWVALTFFVLSLDGAALSLTPAVLRLPVAAAAGLFNAWAWLRIVDGLARRPAPVRFLPLAPVGIATLTAVVVGGAALGFDVVAGSRHLRHAAASRRVAANGRPVLIVAGFASHWGGGGGDALDGGFDEQRFSYRGLQDGRPLPYRSGDTYKPIGELTRLMADQVTAFHNATGRPISVVAESEGALVAKTFLTATPDAPVDQLIMLSPLVQPGRVYYPPAGHDGWGVATGLGLSGLAAGLNTIAPFRLTPDTPLLRSILDQAPRLRGVLACPLPGVRQLALFPLADAVVAPHPTLVGIPSSIIPAFHGGLLGNGSAHKAIALQLQGHGLPGLPIWSVAERLIEGASSAWQVPTLPLTLNRAWSHGSSACPS